MKFRYALFLGLALPTSGFAEGELKFEKQVIDNAIEIGYGLAIADVDGDGKSDIVLADKKEFAWYRNPDWKRIPIIRNLTFRDNVCVAARDIDGDGKAEIAVGANWNPGETVDEKKSGAVFYLERPDDVTKELWKAVMLKHEPTVHRMHWVMAWEGNYRLCVQPLHGRGNRGGKGEFGAKLLSYEIPKNRADASGWVTSTVEDRLRSSHNFDIVPVREGTTGEEIAIAGAEGIAQAGLAAEPGPFIISPKNAEGFAGAGEVRFDLGTKETGWRYATIEPMHGNNVVVYAEGDGGGWERTVLDDSLSQGHALAWGDLLGQGESQVVAGWRNKDKDGKVGIRLYARDESNGEWSTHTVDDNTMACEDLKLADLNGDGKLDIVAAGRATKNVIIYWNKN